MSRKEDSVLTLAHTPDSDDAFMFHAIARQEVDLRGLKFRNVVEDIESLNQAAERGRYDITALSLHALAFVSDRYLCMRSGASVGDGYGPVLVAREPLTTSMVAGRRVAVPGERTTATLLLKLFVPECRLVVRPFLQVPDAVLAGDAELGLLIHEGQLTYGKQGLSMVMDLGAWWKNETGLPVVLGVNAIRASLDPDVRGRAAQVLRDSVAYALQNRDQAMRSARKFIRSMEAAEMARFVAMYVNEFTLDLGESGERSARELLRLGSDRGLIPARSEVRFA